MNAPRLVRSTNVLLPTGAQAADIVLHGGRIESVADYGEYSLDGGDILDVGDHFVMPGLVDSHVHRPDLDTLWEGFASATRAAAGESTLIDMPLNSVPIPRPSRL
ncbi:MAG: hypothetical protein R3C68_18925 [Myxococcota bacterium]